MSYHPSAEEAALIANGEKLDEVIKLLEQLVKIQSGCADGAKPGYERVYGFTGSCGQWVIYPDNEPHYRKTEPNAKLCTECGKPYNPGHV